MMPPLSFLLTEDRLHQVGGERRSFPRAFRVPGLEYDESESAAAAAQEAVVGTTEKEPSPVIVLVIISPSCGCQVSGNKYYNKATMRTVFY